MTRALTIVSYSELDTYRQCPLKHQLAYLQRWTRPNQEGSALDKGTLYHAVLEAHYRTIWAAQRELGRRVHASEEADILAACRQAVRPLLSNPVTGTQTETQVLIEWMYQGHVQRYGADRDWLILGVEDNRLMPLLAESGRTSPTYRLKMKIDLIVKDRQSDVWIVDHKTCSRLPNRKELDMDDQFGLYIAGMRHTGTRVRGAIHSAARTQRNKGDIDGTKLMSLDERFARTATTRTDRELDNLLMDASRCARASRLPGHRYSSPDPDRCGWRCDFQDAHLMMRKGMPPKRTLQDMGFVVDPTRH